MTRFEKHTTVKIECAVVDNGFENQVFVPPRICVGHEGVQVKQGRMSMHNELGKTWGLTQPFSVPAQLSRVFVELRIDGAMDVVDLEVGRADSRVHEQAISFDVMRFASTQ